MKHVKGIGLLNMKIDFWGWLGKYFFHLVGGLILFLIYSLFTVTADVRTSILATLLIFGGGIYQNVRMRQREIDASHFTYKKESLLKFTDMFFSLIKNAKTNKKIPTDAMIDDMAEFKKLILVWGSLEVLRALKNLEDSTGDADKSIKAGERLLKALREDIGHDDFDLNDLELISVFISDVENIKSDK